MENKKMRTKFQIGVVTFAIVFFLVLGGLTYLSTQIDSLLYPTVTAAYTNSGTLSDNEFYDPTNLNTLIPTSSIHNGEVYYLIKNTEGNYIVASKPIEIIDQNGIYTEIPKESVGYMTIIDCDKDIKVGDQVLVKADIL